MAIDLNAIRLSEEDKLLLLRAAEAGGKTWRETLHEALSPYEQGILDDEVDIDEEIRDVFGVEPNELKPVGLERVREILSKVPGSLADDIIAERRRR